MIIKLVVYDQFSTTFKPYIANVTDDGFKNHILNFVRSDECIYWLFINICVYVLSVVTLD